MTDRPEPMLSADEKPTWGLAEVVIGMVLLFVVSGVVAGIWQLISGEHTTSRLTLGALFFGLLGAWIAFGGTAAYCSLGRPGGFKGQLGLSFKWPDDLHKGIGIGMLGQVMVELIYLPVQFLDNKTAKSVSSVAEGLTAAAHGFRWIPVVLLLAVLAPFFEEMFFRGVVLRAFSRKWGAVAGVIISGLLFGLAHFEGIQTPALVAFGWLLAWRASKTGRIGETIVAHGTFNGVTLIALALS